jgi:hypothetical protein
LAESLPRAACRRHAVKNSFAARATASVGTDDAASSCSEQPQRIRRAATARRPGRLAIIPLIDSPVSADHSSHSMAGVRRAGGGASTSGSLPESISWEPPSHGWPSWEPLALSIISEPNQQIEPAEAADGTGSA